MVYGIVIPTLSSHDIPMIPTVSNPRELCSAAPPPLAQVPDPHAVVVAGSGKHGATRVEIHRHDLESFTVVSLVPGDYSRYSPEKHTKNHGKSLVV